MPRNDDIASDIIKRFDKNKALRGTWESHWQDVAELVFPRGDEINRKRTRGEKRREKVFDSTANLALGRFAATLNSMLTPRAQKWHRLRSTDVELNNNPRVRRWFEESERVLFEKRYSQRANFASQLFDVYQGLGAFGTAAMFIDEDIGVGLRYKSIFIEDLYFDVNHQGLLDTVFRVVKLSARQAKQKFSEPGDSLPDSLANREEGKGNEEEIFEFLHVVMPREDRNVQSPLAEDMPFASFYLAIRDTHLVREGGFRTMPYVVPRYALSHSENYGRGPAIQVLPDIKMLNEMQRTTIVAAHKAIDPPLLMHDDGILSTINTRPGGLNVGGISPEGRQLVQPLQAGANFAIGEDQKERLRTTINDAFLVTLFQILTDNPRMTATEVMERAQEKGALLSPSMERLQTEMLAPMIERELDILGTAGLLPPMPQELIDRDGEFEIEYDSPLSRAQRAEEVVGVQRWLGDISGVAQFAPEILDHVNPDELSKVSSQVHGVPFSVQRTDKEVEEVRAQRAQQQQQAAQAAAIPDAAKAAKDVASAQSIAEQPAQGTA